MTTDLTLSLAAQVRAAHDVGRPLRIVGGNSKPWLGREVRGEALDVAGHRGIVSYEPTELVLTARAGTPLAEIEAALAERNQCLAFEPPHFGPAATLGGTVACNLSGPARPYAGACRDFVLGVRMINGRGEVLRFGGEVMKNVAGYDLSRLMAGAQGTLGVLLEVSLKVLPRPATERTLAFEMDAQTAVRRFNAWAGQPVPITAACHDGERAWLRLAGAEAGVRAAHERLGGEVLAEGAAFWRSVREQTHAFFSRPGSLWRLSLPLATEPVPGVRFIDWGGALHWVYSEAPLWDHTRQAGGHATRWHAEGCGTAPSPSRGEGDHTAPSPSRGEGDRTAPSPLRGEGDRTAPSPLRGEGWGGGGVFQPLAPGLLALHRRLKQAFDPRGILNPGRLYAEF